MEAHFVPPPRPVAAPSVVVPEWVLDYRRYALAVAFVATFAEGLGLTWQREELRVLVAFAQASALALYCPLDARALGKHYLRTFQWLLMFTWPVGLLVHFVWTRGPKGIGLYLALLALGGLILGLGAALAALIQGL